MGGIATAALAADESATAFYSRLENAGGDFIRAEHGGAGGKTISFSSRSLSSSTSFSAPSSSSLSLFSRGDEESINDIVPIIGASCASEQAAALHSSCGDDEEGAWGAPAAAAVACRPAKKKKRLVERGGGLAINF